MSGISSLLGSTASPGLSCWSGLHCQAWAILSSTSPMEYLSDPIREQLVNSTTIKSLLFRWSYLAWKVWLLLHRVHSLNGRDWWCLSSPLLAPPVVWLPGSLEGVPSSVPVCFLRSLQPRCVVPSVIWSHPLVMVGSQEDRQELTLCVSHSGLCSLGCWLSQDGV